MYTLDEVKEREAEREQAFQDLLDAMVKFNQSEGLLVIHGQRELEALDTVFGLAARRVLMAQARKKGDNHA